MVGSIPGNPPYASPLVSEANNVGKEGRKLAKRGYRAKLEEKQSILSERLGDTNLRNFRAFKRARRRRRPTSVTEEWHPSGVPFLFSPFLHISCDLKLVLFFE